MEVQNDVRLDRIATGGAAIGSLESGKTVLVTGAIPGEVVDVELSEERSSVAFGTASKISTESADRVDPVCENVERGCGGCDWQHIAQQRQSALRVEVVEDCLRRIAKVKAPVSSAPALPLNGYRTTLRLAVKKGRAAYRKSKSNELLAIDTCSIADPALVALLEEPGFGKSKEVTLRVSQATGERICIVETYEGVSLPADVVVVSHDDLDHGADVFLTENVLGHDFKVSAMSFFQSRPDGAAQLAGLVNDMISPDAKGDLLDAYCGVGLFGVICGQDRSVFGVEASPSSVSDAGANYKIGDAVEASLFERWDAQKFETVIADPPRAGLKAKGVAKVIETEASEVALVSCDPASLARDAAEFAKGGYELKQVKVSDCFGQTSHVETVSLFVPR